MCDNTIFLITADLRIDASSDRTVVFDTAMAKFQKFDAPDQGDRASKRFLLVLGASDSFVSFESGEASYSDAWAARDPVHMGIYPALDHSAALTASAPEVLSLFEKRFSNATFATSCANERKIPFNFENASRPLSDH